MKVDQIIELYGYNKWANEKVLSFVSKLDPSDFHRDLSGSFSSIHGTLLHILRVEELWLSRWLGEEGHSLAQTSNFQSYLFLKNQWVVHSSNMDQFLSSLTDDALVEKISYKNIKGVTYSLELWKQMLHMSNHSSYHRGQVVNMLRQLNLQPPSADLIYYYLGER